MASRHDISRLLERLEQAGGQGVDLDRLSAPVNAVTALVREGRAHISFGRLYVTRRTVR